MFPVWLARRYLNPPGRRMSFTVILGVIGIALGVASLVVAMAVFSGYVGTLKKSVIDLAGHFLVIHRGEKSLSKDEIAQQLKIVAPNIEAMTPFVVLEGVAAHKGVLSSIMLEGLSVPDFGSVVRLQDRLLQGELKFETKDGSQAALIGKDLAAKLKLVVGDSIKVVLPMEKGIQADSFRPKLERFVVSGILDLGRHEYNNRYVVTDIEHLRGFAELKDRVTGYRVRIADADKAELIVDQINEKMSSQFWAKSWVSYNRNLFKAAELEKRYIFVVLLVMLVAAAFNVAIILFINVLTRYPDISVLKTMGARSRDIVFVFVSQSLVMSVWGTVLGGLLGAGFCVGFLYLQEWANILPSEVYNISYLHIEFKLLDLGMIVVAVVTLCGLASLIPALRGARINIVDGLRYE